MAQTIGALSCRGEQDVRRIIGFGWRIRQDGLLDECFDLGASLVVGSPGFKPSGKLTRSPGSIVLQYIVRHHGRDRNHHIGENGGIQPKVLARHDANDGECFPVHPYGLVQNSRIAIECPLPQAIADDDDRGRYAQPIVIGSDGAPQDWQGSQHSKVVAGHQLSCARPY